tara:strand:+ start:5350 stop:5535 length:186 start_codon:yes stop_codon:yes gene_type:complete
MAGYNNEGSTKAARAISNYFGGPSEKKKKPKEEEEKDDGSPAWYDIPAQVAERKKKLNAGK